MSQIADVIIVGAGILGCSIAYSLEAAGVRRVTVVDRGPLVSGMTRRSAGLVHTFERDGASMALAQSSQQTFRDWGRAIGGACGYNECGTLLVARTAEEERWTRDCFAHQSDLRIRGRQLEPSELASFFPMARFPDVRLATWEPDSGYVDPVLASQTLAQKARERGASFETGSHVKLIGQQRGRITGITTTTGSIESPVLIISAGTGAERLLAPLGVKLNLSMQRGVIGFFEQSGPLQNGHPTIVDAGGSGFIRSHSFHLSAAGIIYPPLSYRGTDTIDENVSLEEMNALSRLAGERFPALEAATLKRSHAILYDRLADGRPALGAVPGFDGLYVAAGFGPSAAAVAPAVGRAIAQMVVDGAARQDLLEISLSRPGIRTGGQS